MISLILAVIIGLLLLVWSADKFIDGAANLARNWGISPFIIGVLIVGLGTSAPEMLVAAVAALQGNPGIGIGNALGSNITNITLVLGFTALLANLPVRSEIVKQELPLILCVGLFSWILMADHMHSRFDGILLLTGLFAVLFWLARTAKKQQSVTDPLLEDSVDELPDEMPFKSALIWTAVGLVLLLVSSKVLVWGASGIASQFGVSDLVIGLTVVAIGTSLPELAASISSVKKGDTDLAIGNIVGSNLFNNLGVLAIPALISPGVVPDGVLNRDMPIMMAVTLLLIVLGYGLLSRSRYMITRGRGAFFLMIFVAYQFLLYYQH
ncbi:calcium/sodium antiporter [Leucothrix pacifica]|uniref:Calcium/sodium antiporter n=1 Tax=Leucothrix pacifica TaxID=1247513 RepID=A0A317CF56_9GAMM|nr:calcium/sodium antiporter [Leucothrix pacifica]PWQ94950.1 calcium/sodium antiporter [Leucothrix pacifica]